MNEEGKKKLHRMFFKMMAMASSNTSSWYEKDEELLDEIDKFDNRRNTLFNRQASMSSGKSSSGKRRMENTGYIKLTTVQEKERLRNITMLLKIPYELNKMSLLGTAVSSNNMRTLRFFCKILKTYDENLRKEGEASTLSECLNMSNDMNHTPLMIAAESGYIDIINELVRLGADMTFVNKYEMNCLHLAVERNRVEAVKVLLDHATTHLRIDSSESFSEDDQNFFKADAARKSGDKGAMRRFNDSFWMVPWKSLKAQHRRFLRLVQRTDELRDDTYSVTVDNAEYDDPEHHEIREHITSEILFYRRLKVVGIAKRCIWSDGVDTAYLFQPQLQVTPRDKLNWTSEETDLKKKIEEDWTDELPGPLWFFASNLEVLYNSKQDSTQRVQNYSDEEDRKIIYVDDSPSRLKCKPQGIISRECRKGATKYKVAWDDESLFATWHDEHTIVGWQHPDTPDIGRDLVNKFNGQGDNLIRIFLNSRNQYGKSPFISTLEFDRPEILQYLINARHTDSNPSPWLLQRDDYFLDTEDGHHTKPVSLMKYNLLESRNGVGVTTLHYCIQRSNALVKLFLNCYLEPIDTMMASGHATTAMEDQCRELITDIVALCQTRGPGGDTPLSWVCGVGTETGRQNAELFLDVLDRHDSREVASTSAQSYLNRHSESKSMLPNAENNYLMRAAKAGNLPLCQLFIERGANNAPSPQYKSAAEYAFEAKYYDVGYFLDKELLRKRLSFEFVRRVYASVQVEFLSELDELVDTIADAGMRPATDSTSGQQIVLNSNTMQVMRDDELVEKLVDVYEKKSSHVRHLTFKMTEFVSRNREVLHSISEELAADDNGGVEPEDNADYMDSMPIKDLLLLESIKRLRDAGSFARADHVYINEVCDAFEGISGQHQKRASDLTSVANVLNYEPCRLYWVTPPVISADDEQNRYLVKKIGQDKKMADVKQHAMDHYMARIDLFGRVARLAAIDDDTFQAFCSIVDGSVIKDPTRFINEVLNCFYEGLRDEPFVPHQKILTKLVLLSGSLDSARKNSLPMFDGIFDDENAKIVYSIREIFACKAMLDPDTVKTVVMPVPSVKSYVNPTVMNARAFYMPVISNALKLELTGLFGTQQISGYIDKIFRGNLRASGIPVDYRRSMDIFNPIDVCKKQVTHRNTEAWEHLRYSPYAMFLMEALSKIAFLGMVFYVAIYKMGEIYEPPHDEDYDPFTWEWYDLVLGVLLGATILREIGEFFGNTADMPEEQDRDQGDSILQRMAMALYAHFLKGVWNMLDLLGIICVFMWAILKFNEMAAVEARAFLSVAAIPMSLGILRYASVDRDMGNLIITLISMSKDVYSFLFVLVVALFGFLSTMRALFQFDHLATDGFSLTSGFSTFYSTQLTLLDASMGNVAWDYFDGDNPYFELGIFLQIIFILFFAVILFNLLIAKMTTTYEQKEKASLEDWEYTKADIVKQFMLIGEASPLCMLPVPLNLITTALYIPHALIINSTFFGNPFGYGLFSAEKRLAPKELQERSELREISLAGTVADCVLGLISAPAVASYEIVMDVFQILGNTWTFYEKVQKKLAERSTERAPIVNILLAITLISLLAFTHTALHLLLAPMLFVYYIYQHLYATFTEPVELEFMAAGGPQLQIRYREDPLRKFTPKTDLQSNRFSATVVRGKVTRKGKPFADRPTKVRISSGPYSSETSAAVLKCSNELAWHNLPMNTKQIVSFPQNKCFLPTFPLGGDDLMRNLKISIITAHADGDLITASTQIHSSQLHRWIYNGRFEGPLDLVSHLEIPMHHHGSGKIDELVFIERPEKFGIDGTIQPCLCDIERSGKGEVQAVEFFPGFGYEAGKKYRVYHLLYSDWKNQGRVNFSRQGKTEKAYSYSERATKSRDGSSPELFVDDTDVFTGNESDKIRYISKYGSDREQVMEEDLRHLKRLMENDEVVVGFRGDERRRARPVKLSDFCGRDRSYDTVSMVTFEVKCQPSGTSDNVVVPVLTSTTSDAQLTVAFYFDVDMSTHLHLASKSQLRKNARGDETRGADGLFGQLKSYMNMSTSIAPEKDSPRGSPRSSAKNYSGDFNAAEILWSNLVEEDHRQEFDGHSRFDDTWCDFLESPLLYKKEELETIFNFIDGDQTWKGED